MLRTLPRPWIPLALLVALLSGAAALSRALAEGDAGDRHRPDPPAGARPSAPVQEPSEAPRREPRRLPGAQPGGSIQLPNQWSLRPAGDQIVLGDFPVNVALHPSGRWAAVLHAGYGEHEVVVVDLLGKSIVSRATVPYAFYGLGFDPAGRRLFASGGEDDLVHAFRFAAGYLSDRREIPVASPGGKGVVSGISTARDGKTLYVARAWGDSVAIVPLEARGARLRHVELPRESYPYTTLPTSDGRRLFVSLWGRSAVAVVDLASGAVRATWKTDSHPTEMALSKDGARLFVACANSNIVTVLDAKTGRALESLGSALHPGAPNGSTPNSLAVSPDGRALAVANADNNDVALFDVRRPGSGASLGFIPAGWYPTCVRFTPKGDRILVANGKGLISRPNREGPNPMAPPPASVREYIAGLFRGTLSILPSPSPAQMVAFTKQAYACSPLRPDAAVAAPAPPAGHPIPAAVGGESPIRHCLYIIKENRTYDQVLGDVPEGNGDPDLCLFPDAITPNHHAIAREFVLLDNFYVESEVSADGHEWSTAAYATDYDEKAWPLVYRETSKDRIAYPTGEDQAIVRPAGGYIWERCRAKGLSYRSYGEFVQPGKTAKDPGTSKLESLAGHFDPDYRSYDLDYSDVGRADRFIQELKRFESEGEMPRFMIMHLPNDHTSGSRAGKPTPTAYLADNDLALGLIVEAVSHSRFWKDTAIFVVEDDAQAGSDHVDAHRTVAFVVSPWTKRRAVDSSLYSTSSMLRTMELILGLDPMSQFDAAALPMYASFQTIPDFTPYVHRPSTVGFDQVNARTAWGSERSETLDFSKPDAADDLVLNEIVWRAVRGADSPMPPPVRAAFVFPHREAGQDGDDDRDDR